MSPSCRAALRSVRPVCDTSGDATVAFTVSDGEATSNVVTNRIEFANS